MHILRTTPAVAKAILIVAGILVSLSALAAAKWNIANSISTKIDRTDERVDARTMVDYAVALGPDDPQTHFAAGVVYQGSFEQEDAARSLSEFELTAQLSPHNFVSWIELAKAHGRAGDNEKTLVALERALKLAPNYADVHWAYGNALIRANDVERANEHLRRAIDGKRELTGAAVNLLMQLYDADVAQVRHALGNEADQNAAIAYYLARAGRMDDAAGVWNAIPAATRRDPAFAERSANLAESFRKAKKFRFFLSAIADNRNEMVEAGTVFNGGFESAVKLRDVPPYDWTLGRGDEPQIALSGGQKRSGATSLLMVFNITQGSDFRGISQYVAVEPGQEYDFEAFYKAELKALGTMRFEILDASTLTPLVASTAFLGQTDWVPVRTSFRVPSETDGVIIQLARTGCTSSICPANGRVWLDDISIRRKG